MICFCVLVSSSNSNLPTANLLTAYLLPWYTNVNILFHNLCTIPVTTILVMIKTWWVLHSKSVFNHGVLIFNIQQLKIYEWKHLYDNPSYKKHTAIQNLTKESMHKKFHVLISSIRQRNTLNKTIFIQTANPIPILIWLLRNMTSQPS